jgi:nucleotide-binding universal stress UspA family protein
VIAAAGAQGVGVHPHAWNGSIEVDERTPEEALVAASREVDLVVLGSRNLKGLAALGSVGERVGHHAACSVLVVRSGEQ